MLARAFESRSKLYGTAEVSSRRAKRAKRILGFFQSREKKATLLTIEASAVYSNRSVSYDFYTETNPRKNEQDLRLTDENRSSALDPSLTASQSDTMTTNDPPIPPFSMEVADAPSKTPRPLREEDYLDDENGGEVGDEDAGLLEQEKAARASRPRAGSIMSFDFSNRLLLQASEDVEQSIGGGTQNKSEKISLISGIALIVGLTIGSGIFASSGVVARETGSVNSSLFVWLGAGLLSWAGGSSFAELGTMLPQNGGAQVYLQAAYGAL